LSENIFIAVAWPYANGPLHMGHLAGCYLPSDIFARYHRSKGNNVLMVSGSDSHGTPITIKAEQLGVDPVDVFTQYHNQFLECWEQLGISFDLFTSTHTENHKQVVHDIFLDLHKKGWIYLDSMLLAYCETCNRFLPDRYVEGQCPHCKNLKARGDQCDSCGKTLDPQDLINPACAISGTTPQFKESEHFFLKLSAFEKPLLEWISDKTHWRPNVKNFTTSFLQEGLKDRAITRDLDWGINVPIDEYSEKKIYVWFEAVIGYYSAAIEWSKQTGKDYEVFWTDPATKSYYFIGKDNIPFHTIIWPAIIMARGNLNLPFDVPANEFLSLENRKISTSQNWAVWLPDYLSQFDPDPLRYALSINMPETGDTDFSWAEFIRRNNDELVATYGNLVNRVLSFTHKNFDGKIPEFTNLSNEDNELLNQCRSIMHEVDQDLYNCKFKAAITKSFGLAQKCNRYLDFSAPWKEIKNDRDRTGTILWTSIAAINCLRVMLSPFLPFSSSDISSMLNISEDVFGWDVDLVIEQIVPNTLFNTPSPLFKKLDLEEVNQ
jgi:methionyl-tRNA synthetase